MKRSVMSILSVGAVLSFLLTATACGSSSDAGSEGAEVAETQAVEVQEDLTVDTAIADDAEVAEDDAEVTDDAEVLTQDQLYYRCMNTLETLDQLSGSVSILDGNRTPHVFEGEFQFDFTNDLYHALINAVPVSDEYTPQTHEVFNNGQECETLMDYNGTQENICQVESGDMCSTISTLHFANAYPDAETSIDTDQNNTQVYGTYGGDPTGAHEIAACFVPQEMTVGYLKDFSNWEITGTQEVQGRTCAVVEGTADPEYGSRFGVETFTILVDQATGIWMQFEGYDADGNVQAYVYTENLAFGADAEEVPVFQEEYAQGYTLQDMNALAEEQNAAIEEDENQ